MKVHAHVSHNFGWNQEQSISNCNWWKGCRYIHNISVVGGWDEKHGGLAFKYIYIYIVDSGISKLILIFYIYICIYLYINISILKCQNQLYMHACLYGYLKLNDKNHHPCCLSAEVCNNSLFEVLQYAVCCCNSMYRLLHWRGLWLSPEDGTYVAKAIQEMTES